MQRSQSFETKSRQDYTLYLKNTPVDGTSLSDTTRRRFAIGSIVMDIGDGPAEFDNSETNLRLGLVGRGLYSTANSFARSTNNAASAQNGPVEVQILQDVSAAH